MSKTCPILKMPRIRFDPEAIPKPGERRLIKGAVVEPEVCGKPAMTLYQSQWVCFGCRDNMERRDADIKNTTRG